MIWLAFVFVGWHASAQEKFTVYFDSNKWDLKKTELTRLQEWIAFHANDKIVAINGYTDEDGTTGFNDTLAAKRVTAIYKLISGKVKIREDFQTRSYGEQHDQSANKAENRRVSIYYILSKDLAREDEILGIKVKLEPKPETPRAPVMYPKNIVLEGPGGSKKEYVLNQEFMKQVGEAKAGEKLKIDNLNFVINTFAVVNESRPKLYELLIVMERNPQLKIEIQGHLCCMPTDKQDLSTQRAKAVYNFLIKNGIDKSRLSYKGFGSSQPVFPIPEKDEPERAANRRVEVAIVAN